jgi:IclR family acetate operon transcriptional repressor
MSPRPRASALPPGAPAARPKRSDVPERRPGSRRGGTLESGLDIIETLATCGADGLGVTDLARQLEFDKGNVYRLLQVLAQRGYVQQDAETRRWTVTVQLVALARGVLRSLDVRTLAESEMGALVSTTGEASHLAVRTRRGGIYVAQERPYGRVSVETEIGSTPLLHATATGKALLAWLDHPDWRDLVRSPLLRCTERTITTLSDLDRELAAVRARGFAIDDGEFQADVRCVAAPILDHGGVVVASLGVSCPADRLTRKRLPELGETVHAAADRVTRALGGVPATQAPPRRGSGRALNHRQGDPCPT